MVVPSGRKPGDESMLDKWEKSSARWREQKGGKPLCFVGDSGGRSKFHSDVRNSKIWEKTRSGSLVGTVVSLTVIRLLQKILIMRTELQSGKGHN